jgi:hypothetical protein
VATSTLDAQTCQARHPAQQLRPSTCSIQQRWRHELRGFAASMALWSVVGFVVKGYRLVFLPSPEPLREDDGAQEKFARF